MIHIRVGIMPRDIPLGNGKLLVCFDRHYAIRDLYFPHVGQENHIGGDIFRFGVWVEDQFSWIGSDWKIDLAYREDTLVSDVALYHEGLGILMRCHDAVDFHENIYLREIIVENMRPAEREVRLFFSHAFSISGNNVGDTAAFDPKSGGIVHYKGPRYFLLNGRGNAAAIDQFAVGQAKINNREGTYRDAEDGVLSANPIAQGSVDSVIGIHLTIKGMGSGRAFYWLTAGEDWEEVRRLDRLIQYKEPQSLLKRTADYWKLWDHKETPHLEVLPPQVGELYRRSLLVLRTQIDWQGGILAANDSDVILFNRDTYSYIWPRDGALVANAMDVAGYPMIAQRFYQFAARVIRKEGYFLHKYNPDGTLASSWHPWTDGSGQDQLPIQEDETALVLWALWNHFVIYRDIEFIKPLYRPLVKKAADFMCRYRDELTGLPAESYDLWEERRGILSFTVGAVFGGLTAASLFCTVFGEEEKALQYQQTASEIRDAASHHLWLADSKRFCRMVYRNSDGQLTADSTCDSSIWGLFAFGLYTVDDPRIESTMQTLKEKLWIKTKVGGMARYEHDGYHNSDDRYPGNPWFICTLWLADYLIEKAHDEKSLAEAIRILEWAAEHALPSGVLAEQVNPLTGEPVSVSPLTWSHATFVASTQRILRKIEQTNICPSCGISPLAKVTGEDWLAKLYSETCSTIHGLCKIR